MTNITNAIGIYPIQSAKNIIIGGNFDTNPWQTTVLINSVTNNSIVADNFKFFFNSSAVFNVGKIANAPSVSQGGAFYTNSMNCTVNTGSATGAAQKCHFTYVVEGSDWSQIYQTDFTLSFWVNTTRTGTYHVSIFNAAGTRIYIAPYTISAGSTWTRVVINVPTDTTGSWNVTPGTIGAYINFTLAAGSTYQGSSGWQTAGSGLYATSSQVDFGANTLNSFNIDLVYLQPGTVLNPVYPFEVTSEILLRSQRYYETSQSYESGFYFPSSDQTGGLNTLIAAASTSSYQMYIPFKVQKAIVPTMTLCDSTPATGKVFKGGNGKTASVASVGLSGFNGGTSDATSTNNLYFQWQANAYLF